MSGDLYCIVPTCDLEVACGALQPEDRALVEALLRNPALHAAILNLALRIGELIEEWAEDTAAQLAPAFRSSPVLAGLETPAVAWGIFAFAQGIALGLEELDPETDAHVRAQQLHRRLAVAWVGLVAAGNQAARDAQRAGGLQ